nr:EOG090X0ALT [Triops cancriformis]
MAFASSFQKKSKAQTAVHGAKLSVNGLQTVSSGIASLDHILDGGLPIGTICLLEEGSGSNYSRLFSRLFIAEGVVHGNYIFAATLDGTGGKIVDSLPSSKKAAEQDADPASLSADMNDKMKIAWRYENLHAYADQAPTKSSTQFDFSQVMKISDSAREKIHLWQPSMSRALPIYFDLLASISHVVEQCKLSTEQAPNNVLRISLTALGSPFWDEKDCNGSFLPSFVVALRALLRRSSACVFLTVPTHLIPSHTLSRLRQTCDAVIRLSGMDAETKKSYPEVHGILTVASVPMANALRRPPQSEPLTSYGFKFWRKKCTIEKLHLPPDLSDSASRSTSGPACGGGGSKLDF